MIDPFDSYSEKVTMGIYEVLQAHLLLVGFLFRSKTGIGEVGPRDANLLHSALTGISESSVAGWKRGTRA